ncbi:alpha-glucan family phosphorylase [Synechococcus sp. PCC 7336]|uniref:alpha-glucan family phosphorylase n=1 Tax=Synechococcus sp. PCC 7336 TaxID=195250 RepID=UPI000346E270|nr:alpha-glucan family phosphorylase [Synechococcus sp. PCC 7336]
MKALRTFRIAPYLPQPLEALRELAYNLHFSWNVETRRLFRRMQPQLWETSQHNPVQLLGQIDQARLDELAGDEGFLAHMERASQQLHTYLAAPTWYQKHRQDGAVEGECFAYFSAEFGLADCLPIYSGGLGILAGDHLKSASDLGLPLVGVGLLYQKGYFRQYLNPDGWQQERYPVNDFYNMPLELEHNPDGSELRIRVDYPNRPVYARIWRVRVGRISLYLLDTNIDVNSQYDQNITDELYGGDKDLRIHQEIMLGIGGIAALRALGISPTLFHMNEGHSAFLGLERIRLLMAEKGLNFTTAFQVAKSSQIFTTHTPVPAGIDLFPPDKIDYYLGRYYKSFGLSREQFMGLGRENTGDFQAPFSMAVLAINTASFVNGVSKLHSHVSREMFGSLWQSLPSEEVPIVAVTNGIHSPTWLGTDNQELLDRYLGPHWFEAPPSDPLWQKVDTIPDEELWRTHDRCRADLVHFARQRLHRQWEARGASPLKLERALEVLNPNALTIGFARRFATYKRATLLLRDRDRLAKLLTDKDRPVQFIFAGKAHPKDDPGKELIREIVHFSREEGVRNRIVFIEDYDMFVASLMVVGADVWLNTPLRPREASGTSGMKAAANGLLNLSILDGWWAEADYYNTGWPIGRGEDYFDRDYQDRVESTAIYDLLEHEIVPQFYNRDSDGLPRQWIRRMKHSMRLNLPQFSTERMVQNYAEQAYFPISGYYDRMRADDCAAAQALVEWQDRLLMHWYHIEIDRVEVKPVGEQAAELPLQEQLDESGAIVAAAPVLSMGQPIEVTAYLHLGQLLSTDVQVELYSGSVDEASEIAGGTAQAMEFAGMEGVLAIYRGKVHYSRSGLQGLALRLLPHHPDLHDRLELRLIRWAE